MAGSIFNDKAIRPDEKLLEATLGAAFSHYMEICEYIQQHFGELTPEWKYYGKKNGWLLKLMQDKRNVLFINPQHGYFSTTFTFGKHAQVAIAESTVGGTIKEEVLNANQYAEGKVLQLVIRSASDMENVLKLIKIKLNN